MNKMVSLSSLKALVAGNRWVQVGLLIAFSLAMDRLTAYLHLPLPGSVAGLLAMWFVLDTGILCKSMVERGADSLLEHLMLFLAPATLGLLDHHELLSFVGLKLLAAVLAGTLLVMAGTALVVEYGLRWSQSREERA